MIALTKAIGMRARGQGVQESRPIGRDRLATFRKAIRATHGADAHLVARERVVERIEGETVWEGEVLVFSLQGHPEASTCYACEVDGQVTAVLGVPPVRSAVDAVRASIMADEGEVSEAG